MDIGPGMKRVDSRTHIHVALQVSQHPELYNPKPLTLNLEP
jgi:hypothetical protein